MFFKYSMKSNLIIKFIILLFPFLVHSQETQINIDTVIYKNIGNTSLILKVFYPNQIEKLQKHSAIVFYSGGGFVSSYIKQFEQQASYFAQRGMISFLADYRVKNRDGTSILECIMDAKSAIRYIREHAEKFNLDENKIVAAGGSAGGYLAVANALIPNYDDPQDNFLISTKPNALILFNPIIDLGPGFVSGYEKFSGDEYKEMSPLHNIMKDAPPTIMFFGTNDYYVPIETAQYYKLVMEAVGSRCDLFFYEDQKHGFFNFETSPEHYYKTIYEADKFLTSLGFLKDDPIIVKEN